MSGRYYPIVSKIGSTQSSPTADPTTALATSGYIHRTLPPPLPAVTRRSRQRTSRRALCRGVPPSAVCSSRSRRRANVCSSTVSVFRLLMPTGGGDATRYLRWGGRGPQRRRAPASRCQDGRAVGGPVTGGAADARGRAAPTRQPLGDCRRPAGHATSNLNNAWLIIPAPAGGLDDVRIHDLRHTYASRALALGESLTMIGKLLGHTQVQTTARYAHLARDSIQNAAARITGSIGGNLVPGEERAPHDARD